MHKVKQLREKRKQFEIRKVKRRGRVGRGGWLIEMAGAAAARAAAHQTCLGDERQLFKSDWPDSMQTDIRSKDKKILDWRKLKGIPRSPKAGMPAQCLP